MSRNDNFERSLLSNRFYSQYQLRATFFQRKLKEFQAFGVVIFSAESQSEAERIMNDDPAVKAGLMTAELHPFCVSLVKGE